MPDWMILLSAAQQLHEPPAGFDLECLQTRTMFAPNAALTLRHRRVGLDVGLACPSIFVSHFSFDMYRKKFFEKQSDQIDLMVACYNFFCAIIAILV
jgi:hypothetical protein